MARKKKEKTKAKECAMQLVQIGVTTAPVVETKTVTIKEMFERLASREQEMIREARERLIASGELKAVKHAH
jgi:hypothetical protein